jgi:hypothetical protein
MTVIYTKIKTNILSIYMKKILIIGWVIALHQREVTVVVVIVTVWYLDLQLTMQPVPITTKVVSSNPGHGEVYSIQHYVIKFVMQ